MSTLCTGRIIVEMAVNDLDREAVLGDIRTLTVATAPLLEQVERTLADGYACVLRAEAERFRLRRRLEERAALLGESPGTERAAEVADIARRIARTDVELGELRAALLELRATARRLRAA
jgi:hypothetical protein